MRNSFIILGLIFCSSCLSVAQGAKKTDKTSVPINVQWVGELAGDFSFASKWSYPMGVEMKENGRAGCSDGGFCPPRCEAMLDSNGNILKDSIAIFYQLLDTTHLFHTIQCEAWCYEWAGTDFISASRKGQERINCQTATNMATHCSLQLDIVKNSCYAKIELNSIVSDNNAVFYCTEGYIRIDKKRWKQGIIKADFSFDFGSAKNVEKPIYWKGKIQTKIEDMK